MHTKTDRTIIHTVKLTNEEAQVIAGALEKLRDYWDEVAQSRTVDFYVTDPAIGKNKRLRIHKEDLDKIAKNFNYMVEGE